MNDRSEVKPIPGFPGYFATADGEIIGKRGRVIKKHVDRDGYFRVGVCIDPVDRRKQTHRPVHRLIAFAFLGAAPSPLHEVAHLDNRPQNNHYKNLSWKTRQENEDDKVAFGTRPAGHRHHAWTLTHAQRLEAKRLRSEGATCRSIAETFGVSASLISKITLGIR